MESSKRVGVGIVVRRSAVPAASSQGSTARPVEATYRITVLGRLDSHWAEWFDGLTLDWNGDGETVLHGPVRDQAALYGLLNKLRDLGLTLSSVIRLE